MEGLLQSPRRLPPTGKLRPGPSSFQSPGLVLPEAFQDLTPPHPHWSEAKGSDSFSITPAPVPSPRPSTKESSGHQPKATVPGRTPPAPPLCPTRVGTWGHRVKEHLPGPYS